jgi:hypothetical protein
MRPGYRCACTTINESMPHGAIKAVVLNDVQLREMLRDVARAGASLAVEDLRAGLSQSPDDATIERLRAYLRGPDTIKDPSAHWAHSGIICGIELMPDDCNQLGLSPGSGLVEY